jgi:hypothetical protein
MSKVLYDDRAYVVTQTTISTPTRYYPIANATARIRRDLLWVAVAATAFYGLAAATYADLLTSAELTAGAGVCAALFGSGLMIQGLSIDAIGHKRILIIGSTRRVRRLFHAVQEAANPARTVAVSEPADDGV